MKLSSVLIRALLLFAAVPAGAQAAYAATITWGAATTISGDADVSTTGALLGAFNIGGPGVAATTVNGVLFNPFALSGASATSGNFNFSNASGFGSNNSSGSASAPFSTLSASYQALLSSIAGDFSTPSILTISALVLGRQYQFEWWTSYSAGSLGAESTVATAGNSIELSPNTTSAPGGVGQFALGTFTADATTQVITFTNGPSSTEHFLDGFQLRDVTAAQTVPEPGTLLLFGSGLAFAARKVRNRRRFVRS
jgi:PEP-CTERM motif-containing protein